MLNIILAAVSLVCFIIFSFRGEDATILWISTWGFYLSWQIGMLDSKKGVKPYKGDALE